MLNSLILDTVTRAAFPTIFVFSVYLLFAGHNAPGGGFVGGLVAGAALVLRYAGRGLPGLRDLLPNWLRFELLLGGGLLLASVVVIAPLAFGQPLMYHYHWHWYLGPLHEVKLATTLFFDTGVYLIVVGLVLGALEMLGRDPAGHADEVLGPEDAPLPPSSPGPEGLSGSGRRSRPTTGPGGPVAAGGSQ